MNINVITVLAVFYQGRTNNSSRSVVTESCFYSAARLYRDYVLQMVYTYSPQYITVTVVSTYTLPLTVRALRAIGVVQ